MLNKIVNDFPTSRTMTSRSVGTPIIIIFSSVLRFIEDQVKAVPDHLETGGLLLGTTLDNGRLITQATPPGPKAIHQEGMFEKDLDFSQAILNHLAQKTGVDYVGEWHKHPPFLNRPSPGDRQGAAAILQDSDYRTKGLLVFPIWIIERKSPPSNIHESLVENYFGPMDAVKCFPYYMDDTLQFYPFDFQVAKCDFGTQSEVVSFYNHYIHAGKSMFVNHHGNLAEKVYPRPCKTDEGSANKERKPLGTEEEEGKEGASVATKQSCFWYETRVGRERLAMETSYLKNSRCYRGARKLNNGRILYRLSSPIYDRVFLDILCGYDHPLSFPDLFLRYKEQYRQINPEVDSADDLTIVNPFCETVHKLNKLWEKPEATMWIYHISNSLGFY